MWVDYDEIFGIGDVVEVGGFIYEVGVGNVVM